MKQFFTSLLCTIGLAGCGAQNQASPAANKPTPSAEATVVKTITVSGFDPDGEPELKEMSDGALMLVFNFMPPSFAEDDEATFADFDKQLERAIGVPVFRDDREVFLIHDPQADTEDKLKTFLEGFRKKYEGK